MNTFKLVEARLKELLSDMDYRVIALTGKWGTGKTYLWRTIGSDRNVSKQKPIYVSVFGAKSSSELKLRILQNAYLRDAKGTRQVLQTLSGIGASWFKRATGYEVENAAIAWLPKLIEERVIAIDDVERKHRSLDIDELLGFLDEYTETHNSRFVVLMNSDNLAEADKELWQKLHEKVIDAEVVLDPTPDEALDVLKLTTDRPQVTHFCQAIRALGLNNIRVIRRALKAIEEVERAVDVGGVPAARWVPSVVLLTASHYKASEQLPPFEYVKSYNTYAHIFREDENVDARHADWHATLEKLEIAGADEFEVLVQVFLESGFLDRDRLKKVFDRYRIEDLNAATALKVREVVRAVWWEPQREVQELVAAARELLPFVSKILPGDLTDLASAVQDLGDSDLAEEFVNAWVATADDRPEYKQVGESDFEDGVRRLHPTIQAKLREIRDRQHPPLSLREVIQRIRENSGWGDREKIALRHSTVDEYKTVLSTVGGAELRQFLSEHLGWVRNGPHDESCEAAMNNFIEACRRLRVADPESRLSRLLEGAFRSNGVHARLVGDAGGPDQPET